MIGVTTRLASIERPNGREMRDSLDVNWHKFLRAALPDEIFLPLPNLGAEIGRILAALPFSGFIFSGGENWGEYPRRDQTEAKIFAWAEKRDLPVLGVCRGAQTINLLMGGSTAPVHGHVGRHKVAIKTPPAGWNYGDQLDANSFHRLGLDRLAAGLDAWAYAPDGAIEAISGASGRLCGIMWHPEREDVPAVHDKWLFQKILGRK